MLWACDYNNSRLGIEYLLENDWKGHAANKIVELLSKPEAFRPEAFSQFDKLPLERRCMLLKIPTKKMKLYTTCGSTLLYLNSLKERNTKHQNTTQQKIKFG